MGGAPGKTADKTGRAAWPRRRQARYDYKHRNRNPSNRRAHRSSPKPRERKFGAKIGGNWHSRRLSNNLKRRLERQKGGRPRAPITPSQQREFSRRLGGPIDAEGQ